MRMFSAADVIRKLGLKPHPEGGHFRETFRDARTDSDSRSVSTAIYFLLAGGERSHWHRIDAVEVWHYYAGAPLVLEMCEENGPIRQIGRASCRERVEVWVVVGCVKNKE